MSECKCPECGEAPTEMSMGLEYTYQSECDHVVEVQLVEPIEKIDMHTLAILQQFVFQDAAKIIKELEEDLEKVGRKDLCEVNLDCAINGKHIGTLCFNV